MDHKTNARYSLGVDPGWKNLGLAIVKEDEAGLSLVHSETFNPVELGGVYTGTHHILERVAGVLKKSKTGSEPLHSISIERFVSYNNILTAESENILMMIGALEFGLRSFFSVNSLTLYRAIDWKQDLVKLLVKHRGFDNPSTSLDKKFSIAAAHACLDVKGEFSNDHEADAVCLSAIGFLKERYSKPKKALSNDTTTP